MYMQMFYFDIFSQICKYLNNKDKINLSAISVVTDRFKYKLIFTRFVLEKQIRRLSFCDNFEYLCADCICDNIPKGAKKLRIECRGMCKINSELTFLGENITDLLLYQCLDRPPERECYVYQNLQIPNSVASLTTGGSFNQSIENLIPNSVTHLTLGWYFDKSIKNNIPNSVTHLTLPYRYDNFVSPLPKSVKCLKLKTGSQPPKNIVLSGKDLINLHDNTGALLRGFVPSSIDKIIIE
uniref:F-box domain-containing protein n=1 Tax=viral metagenome TaxID=1070528 RepID=A0A6C0C7Y0_9ZZZZ